MTAGLFAIWIIIHNSVITIILGRFIVLLLGREAEPVDDLVAIRFIGARNLPRVICGGAAHALMIRSSGLLFLGYEGFKALRSFLLLRY